MIDVAPYRAPHGIQLGHDGMLYVSCDLDKKVLVIDPRKRSIEAAIDTEGTGHWITLTPDDTKIFVSNKNVYPFISVIDVKQRKMVDKIDMPNGTQGVAASPDGKFIVAVDFKEPVLAIIDPVTDKVTEHIALTAQTKGAFKPYFTPDSKKLLILSDSSNTVTVLDTANLNGEQKVLQVGATPMGVAFSADGKTALVANHGDGTVSVIDLKKVDVTGNFKGGKGIETLSYY